MLLAARDRVQCERQTTEALALMPVTMVLPTMTTKNATITHEKLSRTPCSRAHLGDAPSARLWPFVAHPTDRYRWTIDGSELQRLCHFPCACCDGRMAQLRGASWPTNNGRRNLIDSCGTQNTAPSGRWPQAKLLRQCSCPPGDRSHRWRRDAKSAYISQTRSGVKSFLTWVYGGRA